MIRPPLHPAVQRLQAQAVANLGPDDWLSMETDTHTFSAVKGKPPAGLLAIATPVGSVVIAIDLHEFPAAMVTVLEHAGCTHPPKAYPKKVDSR